MRDDGGGRRCGIRCRFGFGNESAILEHGADGRFVAGINNGGSGKRVGHSKGITRHVVFTNYVIDCWMKTEVCRSKLVYFVVIEDGGGRYQGRYKRNARSWAKSVVRRCWSVGRG